jgi:hypothetical protein
MTIIKDQNAAKERAFGLQAAGVIVQHRVLNQILVIALFSSKNMPSDSHTIKIKKSN